MSAISVVMPVFNGANFLRQSIEAILNQQFQDFEFIIINDGSTDASEEIIRSYSDKRIVYLENERNLGIVASLNKGLAVASGRYIVRTDADDIALPQMLGDFFTYLEEHPECIVCGGFMQSMDGDIIYPYPCISQEIRIYTLTACPFSHSTVAIRSGVLKENHLLYEAKYKDAEDYALWSMLLPFGQFHNLGYVTLLYRESVGQITAQGQYSANRIASLSRIYALQGKEYFGLNEGQARLYADLVLGGQNTSSVQLSEIGKLLSLVLTGNSGRRLFDQERLRHFLFVKWHAYCKKYPGNTVSVCYQFLRYLLQTGNFIRSYSVVSLIKARI
jgi:glycosyltransferase involved in cell wall biosynthesis